MGRTTVTGRGWVRRTVVATAAATGLLLVAPMGMAAAAVPLAGAVGGDSSGSGASGSGGAGSGSAGSGGAGSGGAGSGSSGSGGSNNGNSGSGGSNNGNSGQGGGQSQNGAADAAKKAADAAQKAADANKQQQQDNADAKAKADAAKKEAAQEAEAKEKAAQKAAEAAAKERARAAKRAAQLAAAGQRARVSWNSHARPSKMVIVRSRTIDLVTNGSLTRQIPRSPGSVSMTDLSRALPDSWLSIANGSAQLSAAVVLSPGVFMDIGGDVREVKLAGGATPAAAASLYTGSGKMRLRNTTISSIDPSTGQPVAAGPGRPFIVVSSNGQFDVADSTISDLGTSVEPEDRPGVLFGINSSGSMVRTQLLRNSVGAKLDRSNAIKLDTVTVSDSIADGLVLRGDKGTTLAGIKAERNGANGVLVTGLNSTRPVTGISTTGNVGYGVVVAQQDGPKINGIVTNADGAGGIRLSRSTNAVVTDITTTDEPIGVLTHAGSTKASLDQLRITGGKRGVVVDKSVTGVSLKASTIEGADVVAVGVAGKQVDLADLGIKDSGTAVRIERGSVGVTASNLTIQGGKDGVISTPGTTNLTLQNLVADGVSSTAIRTFTPDAVITGGRIVGSNTGIDTGASTTITGTTITQVGAGIRARSTDLVKADNVDINAITSGIVVADGSPFVLVGSRIDALEAIHGVVQQQGLNELSLPPLNLLGAIGVPLILLALVLEQVNAFRQRSIGSVRRRLPPSLPAGAG